MQKFEWLFLLNLSPVFLFKVRRARAIKYKPQGIYGPPAEKGSVSRALADVFEKNEKKNKTTSVYRLMLMQSRLMLPSLSLANLNVSCLKGEEPP